MIARRWVPRPAVVDAAVVAAVVLVDLTGQVVRSAGADVHTPPLGVLAVTLALVDGAVFWWRRRRPLTVFVAAVALAIVAGGVVAPGLLAQQTAVTAVLAAFAVGCWSTHRRWAVVLPAVTMVLFVLGSLDDGTGVATSFAAPLAVIGLPWALGSAARNRRLYVEQVEHRLAEAEQERDERARRAVLDERAHIARELHDVVAHHVSLIGVQAGAARVAMTRSPAETSAALGAIEDASRSAVHEMRRLLDVLRTVDDCTEVRPPPGLADLEALVAGFRRADVAVELRRREAGPALPDVVDLCCYRLIEEALTNVARHSAAAAAIVRVERTPDRVVVDVTDPGPPRPTGNGTGRGLTGMRERVALLGGVLTVGPRPEGGFAVRADVPL